MMKKLVIIAFIATILAFCKDARGDYQDHGREIEAYAKRALRFWHKPSSLPKSFRFQSAPVLPNNWIGACDKPSQTIYVEAGYWESQTDTGKLMLIVHEVGHCILQLADDYQDPRSPMYYRQPSSDEEAANVLINLMFGGYGDAKK